MKHLLMRLALGLAFTQSVAAQGTIVLREDFEHAEHVWEVTPQWRIVPLNGHALGVTLTDPEPARLCTRLPHAGGQVAVQFVYVLRGKGKAEVQLGEHTARLAGARTPRTWARVFAIPPRAGAGDFCVDAQASENARLTFKFDDVLIEVTE